MKIALIIWASIMIITLVILEIRVKRKWDKIKNKKENNDNSINS